MAINSQTPKIQVFLQPAKLICELQHIIPHQRRPSSPIRLSHCQAEWISKISPALGSVLAVKTEAITIACQNYHLSLQKHFSAFTLHISLSFSKARWASVKTVSSSIEQQNYTWRKDTILRNETYFKKKTLERKMKPKPDSCSLWNTLCCYFLLKNILWSNSSLWDIPS